MDHILLIFQHNWYRPPLSRLRPRFIRRKRRRGWRASEQHGSRSSLDSGAHRCSHRDHRRPPAPQYDGRLRRWNPLALRPIAVHFAGCVSALPQRLSERHRTDHPDHHRRYCSAPRTRRHHGERHRVVVAGAYRALRSLTPVRALASESARSISRDRRFRPGGDLRWLRPACRFHLVPGWECHGGVRWGGS